MKNPRAWIITGLVGFFGIAATAAGMEAQAPVPKKNIEALIVELADDSFRVRENATKEIWELGEAALPALQEAAKADDPEQSFRVRELIRKIQLHITPDTDPSVMSLVERYAKANPSEKTRLFGLMKGKRAWRQMLKLYASETNAEVREQLQNSVEGVALNAARERLAHGDDPGAREFLELAPADTRGLLALAEFHRSHGTLNAELERARTLKGRRSESWQLALQRAAGNLDAARNAALAAGETRVAAAMAVLAGDPLPWLQEPFGEGEDNAVGHAYAAAAVKHWQNQKLRPADLEPLTHALASRNPSERISAMNALFLLGEPASAEATYVKLSARASFDHFQSLERIPEAMQALGLDPDHPEYKPWVEKRLKVLVTDDIEDQHGVSENSEELVALANFLERKGLHDEAWAAFAEPLAAFAEKDSNVFLDFLSSLFGKSDVQSGAPELAKRVGIAWAGDNEKRWGELISAALGDDEEATAWCDWLGDLDPKASRIERLDGMLALFGYGTDPSGLRAKWLALAWHAIDETPIGNRDPLLERVASLCLETGDIANCLKAWDQLPESKRDQVSWEEYILHLSASGRWQESVALIMKQISRISDAKQEPRVDLHAYAAAALRQVGRNEEAATHDQWVDKLALGDAMLAIQIGKCYAFGNDYKRAIEWWARAARESDPDSPEFVTSLDLCASELLEQGKWKEIAAFSEVIAHIYAGSEYQGGNMLPMMRQRLQADTARALSNLKTDRAGAIALLEKCHRMCASDGSLADFFFPAVRKEGLIKEHDAWFGASWNQMEEIIRRYPESDNTRNTAAWFASRAVRKLDEAEKHITRALASNSCQSAYLDTMAEIQFAKGNREKALEWSALAVNFSPVNARDHALLCRQHERFRSAPLPK